MRIAGQGSMVITALVSHHDRAVQAALCEADRADPRGRSVAVPIPRLGDERDRVRH